MNGLCSRPGSDCSSDFYLYLKADGEQRGKVLFSGSETESFAFDVIDAPDGFDGGVFCDFYYHLSRAAFESKYGKTSDLLSVVSYRIDVIAVTSLQTAEASSSDVVWTTPLIVSLAISASLVLFLMPLLFYGALKATKKAIREAEENIEKDDDLLTEQSYSLTEQETDSSAGERQN